MNDSQDSDYSAFSARLTALRRAALARMLELDQDLRDGARERGDDAVDRADHEQTLQLEMAESEVEQVTLREVEEAEERIAMGCFGLCVGCGIDIPRRRLLAHPTAVRCIDCQSQLEARIDRSRVLVS